jgi:hypothetical protein
VGRKAQGGAIKYLRKNWDEITVLGVLAKLAIENTGDFSFEEEAVVTALRRSSSKLADADLSTLGEYLRNYDQDEIAGVVNNVKGILHEFEFVELENNDGDSIQAAIFDQTNHPGTDVLMFDEQTGESWELQLKATDNTHYVEDWIQNHPDGEIVVTEELAEKLGLPSSGMSNEELTCRVDDVVDRLVDLDEDDSIWDYFPTLSIASVSLIVFSLWLRYRNGILTFPEFKWKAARATGLKVGKIALISYLLTVPGLQIFTGAYLVAKLILSVDNIRLRSFHKAQGPVYGK